MGHISNAPPLLPHRSLTSTRVERFSDVPFVDNSHFAMDEPRAKKGVKRSIESFLSGSYRPKPAASSNLSKLLVDLKHGQNSPSVAEPVEPLSKKARQRGNVYQTSPPTPVLRICNCKSAPALGDDDLVECSDQSCNIQIYHRFCVGLANRTKYPDTTDWRCRDCRTYRPPCSNSAPLPLQQTQATPSVPPPATCTIPTTVDQEPALHPEQAVVVQSITDGLNTFYTGSAGTGKSTVAKAFNKALREQGKQVDVIAPSGIAALAIGGCTIFSYCGWHPQIFKEGLQKIVEKAHGKSVKRRLCKTDVLVIDEISMVENDMFTRLDAVMRAARHGYSPARGEAKPKSRHSRALPFGGAQIVVTGDFCQLPPVRPFQYCLACGGQELEGWNKQDGTPNKCKRCKKEYHDEDKWAFRSPAWTKAKFRCFELKHIHRQSDEKFISILQKCKMGEVLLQGEKDLLLQKKVNMESAVKLLPQKAEVNKMNQRGLHNLECPSKSYNCRDFFDFRNSNEPDLKKKGRPLDENKPDGPLAALKDHRFEESVELKLNMLVILLVNLDLGAGLVNGSQGKIVGFEAYNPNITLVPRPPVSPSGRSGASDHADAISRLATIKENQIRMFIERAPQKEWPIVKFNNGVTRTIYGHCQINELGFEKPHSLIGRTQIPLLAAWAITVHKSQGMTLERVSVDLYNSFEKEMVYVALSRAKNLEGLEVLRLPKVWKVGMNGEVKDFLMTNGLG